MESFDVKQYAVKPTWLLWQTENLALRLTPEPLQTLPPQKKNKKIRELLSLKTRQCKEQNCTPSI